MRSQWNDADARAAVETWGPEAGEALALRIYSSRLIGRDRVSDSDAQIVIYPSATDVDLAAVRQ